MITHAHACALVGRLNGSVLIVVVAAFLSEGTPWVRSAIWLDTYVPRVLAQEGSPPVAPKSFGVAAACENRESASDVFRNKVNTRWQQARKGQIDVHVYGNPGRNSTFEIAVIITRPPAGSDGMTKPQPGTNSIACDLLNVDDEMTVTLVSPHEEAVDIVRTDPPPLTSSVRHLDPGGHQEWKWNVTSRGRSPLDLAIKAEVVYRRDFSRQGRPVVVCNSDEKVLHLDLAQSKE